MRITINKESAGRPSAAPRDSGRRRLSAASSASRRAAGRPAKIQPHAYRAPAAPRTEDEKLRFVPLGGLEEGG
ncbi:MAG: hypothetical protein AAB560_02380, partial [Patescibacteria group bacterium]